jgi:polysaccharide export outer membrane protein
VNRNSTLEALRIGSRIGWTCLLLALAAPGAGLAQEQAPPPAPADAVNAGAPDTSSNYIIGPGDAIQVFVWRNPELSVSVPVRPDGKVSTPLVEDMVAVGKTPTQLARDIEARLAEYIRSPQVNIIVTGPQSVFSRVTVIGQVGAPGPVAYQEGMTVLDVILAAGGLGQFAAGNRAKLVRKNENGKTEEFRIRLEDLVKKGRLKENREVRPGDMLIVPESAF